MRLIRKILTIYPANEQIPFSKQCKSKKAKSPFGYPFIGYLKRPGITSMIKVR